MTAEQRLSAFLQEARGPEQDPVFAAEVMRRVAQRELMTGLATSAVLATAAAFGLWASAPALSLLIEPVSRMVSPVAAVLTLTAVCVVISQNLSVLRIRV
jgi:hypothetical protein